MAQPIYCDAEGCEAQADHMISNIQTGDVLAFCAEHFVGFCIAMADNARAEVEAEVHGPAPDPQARLGVDDLAMAVEDAPKSDRAEVEAEAEADTEAEPAPSGAPDD